MTNHRRSYRPRPLALIAWLIFCVLVGYGAGQLVMSLILTFADCIGG